MPGSNELWSYIYSLYTTNIYGTLLKFFGDKATTEIESDKANGKMVNKSFEKPSVSCGIQLR